MFYVMEEADKGWMMIGIGEWVNVSSKMVVVVVVVVPYNT